MALQQFVEERSVGLTGDRQASPVDAKYFNKIIYKLNKLNKIFENFIVTVVTKCDNLC